MTRCSAISNSFSAWHTAPGHPKSPARLDAVFSSLPVGLIYHPVPMATLEDVEQVHDLHFLRWLVMRCETTPSVRYLDADTYDT